MSKESAEDGSAIEEAARPAPKIEDGEAANGRGTTKGSGSTVTELQWTTMSNMLKAIYDHRSSDGHDPSRLFHKNVNKRNVPDYYDVIKEPMALSVIKRKIHFKEYKNWVEFVRDFALVNKISSPTDKQISHNAQVYNRVSSGAYQDALEVRSVVQAELQKAIAVGATTTEECQTPYLGEIPIQEEAEAEEEEEEEDDEDEEEDEGAGSDDSRKPRRGHGRPRNVDKEEDGGRGEGYKKKRGRPPKVDTPMEGRIKNILKGLRRPRNALSELMIYNFDRLPDKSTMPEYFQSIRTPLAVDILKRKLKRKKYHSVDQFMADVETMFENAKAYNEDNSQVYLDAQFLQKEARTLAAEEMRKPDTDYAMEDGRLPLPEGILHKGELYRVGDWVHLANPNDLTKPIVTQIYRTWQDGSGQKFVNACWYYRPEQTVHRFDKHFLENEVVKTGQYRDHAVEEILDRCFVMFITRYNKGRPRGFPEDKEIYVCEARYNEEKLTFNKIKTWASCLPDEVRDKDYEMDMYQVQRRIKKVPSPIAYLLRDDQKETDDLPKPEWGADNAPPKIGAVHRRPRDPRDSLPPEPTPTPPPREPTPPPLKLPTSVAQPTGSLSNRNTPLPPVQPRPLAQAQVPRAPQTLSPAPLANRQQPLAQTSYQQPQKAQTQETQRYQAPYSQNANYKAPNPVEVYHLSENANASIPLDIRRQFQCDDQGRILFFTAPPLNLASTEDEARVLKGHSVKYLAARARRQQLLAAKRKRQAEEISPEESQRAKQASLGTEGIPSRHLDLEFHKNAPLLVDELRQRVERDYRNLYGEDWQRELDKFLGRVKITSQ